MTVRKAIKILDRCIARKTEIKQGLLDPNESWNEDEFSRKMARGLANHFQIDAENLEKIRNELIPKCKHPKKMRDKSKGTWYCMNCNLDL